MPAAIRSYCAARGQEVPETEGAIVRCALESLALRYRMVLDCLEKLTGSRIETIHIVGGGTQNEQLCQMTANACDRLVIAGPIEATAIGNVMVQALSSGDIGSVEEARAVVARSFPMRRFEPREPGVWDESFGRFTELFEDGFQ